MTHPTSVPDWLPDWKNEKEYPSIEGASDERWAWEFLRRNQKYQEACRQYKVDPSLLKRLEILDGFGITIDKKDDLFSPDNTDLKISCAAFDHFPIIFSRRLRSKEKENIIPEMIPILSAEHIDEVIVKFNAALPIEHQLNEAKKYIKLRNKDLKDLKIIYRQPHKKKLQLFLRLLDAKTCGAKTDEISLELISHYREKLDENETIPSDIEELNKLGDIDNIKDRFRKDLLTAIDIRDEKYIFFLGGVNFHSQAYLKALGIKKY